MNPEWRTIIFSPLSLFALLLIGAGSRLCAFEINIPGDQNISILNNEGWTYTIKDMTSGDFNGDGKNDLIVAFKVLSVGFHIIVFYGPSWTGTDILTNRGDFNITGPSGDSGHFDMVMNDIDNDGKQDLIIRLPYTNYGGDSFYPVIAIRGRSALNKEVLDLSGVSPDLLLRLSGDGGLAAGDFDNDGYGDFACGDSNARSGAGETYIYYGQKSWADVQAGTRKYTFVGKPNDRLGTILLSEDVDRDGTTDLLVDGHIFYCPPSILTPWELAVTSADVKIQGAQVLGVRDLNGDDKPDFFCTLPVIYGPFLVRSLLDGKALTPGLSLIDLTPGTPNYFPPVPIGGWVSDNDVIGDFDGDNIGDLFLDQLGAKTYGYFGADRGTGPLIAISTSAIIHFLNQNQMSRLVKDINGDGNDDFVSYESPYVQPPFTAQGAIHVLFGFVPLTDPFIEIRPRSVPSLQVDINVRVNGQPTEMMVIGDVTDAFVNEWIPFQPNISATLTPDPGRKTVQVKFRNSALRESALASDSWELGLDPGQIVVITNRLTRDRESKARFECHISEDSYVTATIRDINGENVREVVRGQQPPVVLVLEWDGTNDANRRVAPGVYYLVININDKVVRKKIVVRG